MHQNIVRLTAKKIFTKFTKNFLMTSMIYALMKQACHISPISYTNFT